MRKIQYRIIVLKCQSESAINARCTCWRCCENTRSTCWLRINMFFLVLIVFVDYIDIDIYILQSRFTKLSHILTHIYISMPDIFCECTYSQYVYVYVPCNVKYMHLNIYLNMFKKGRESRDAIEVLRII